VLLCDGTWNKPEQLDSGVPAPTNVVKLRDAIVPEDAAGVAQVHLYHRGVGTRSGERWRGGISGYGLSRDVRDVYRFIVQHYEPGDDLFFLGFSRGAFTARSAVGFVRNCGILRRENAARIGEAYRLYRSRRRSTRPDSERATRFRRRYTYEPDEETRIRFIGVWDTVGSLGIPFDGRLTMLLNYPWRFHDTDLSSRVDAAFQALAIDERRGPFKPTLWRQQGHALGQRLEQVWFAGVHCDVGGGYRDPSLSEIPLLWLAERARSCGLALSTEHLQRISEGGAPELRYTGRYVAPDPCGELHDSLQGFYRLLPRRPRRLGTASCETAASTATDRRERRTDYRSPPLEDYLDGGAFEITDIS
jgi:uncharacterized protein (DUF2235 family)